jgi:MarR family
VIDRLERAGYVRRLRDPQDRRVVLVEALPRAVARIAPLYQALAESTAQLNARYSDRQLAVVVQYLSHAVGLVADHVTRLQTERPIARRDAASRRIRPVSRRRTRRLEARSTPLAG